MDDDLRENYRLLARYNRWFNQQLYAAADPLPPEERTRDRGAFFGSIHRTLNHLVVADQVWLRRFRQCMRDQGGDIACLGDEVLDLPEAFTLDMVLYEDWQPLHAKRVQLDTAIEAWLQDMPADFPRWTLRYRTSKGVARGHPAWQALTHFFNHQAHHRGQVTTLLMQAGVDPGTTDLIAMI